MYESEVVTLAVGETGAASNPLGIATVLPPVPSCVKTKLRFWPEVHVAKVLLDTVLVRAVLNVNVVTVPVLLDGHVKVGVALNVVVTTEAALPVPLPGQPTVVEFPLASVQRDAAVPLTVPAI
jgi:hypothetical protein